MRRACFIGRWQPCHKGHEWLIRRKLDAGVPCLVLVRDIAPDQNNPYTTEQTVAMLEAAFYGEDVVIQVIPDIESVNWGRGVGYATIEHEPPPSVYNISGTGIRDMIAAGTKSWRDYVSPRVAEVLELL